ncbi:MAG TPA: PIG-L family deacetylase [Armatimonadota bacterium]|nr:PIG-L family deacetylase [Armatimonadota bacterium]HOM71148.1 PIG-L family deacetylase [Armatimonadota bacterium]HOP79667.1 PIG-L family deacetylase [Armatimonadota bacterium]HPP73750.1 PIG-L family deacetylase [Armatimonadota bacterium]
MQFFNTTAEIFVPDAKPVDEALQRITHIGIAAHQDDLEIMTYPGILECFGSDSKWFMGVVVTDGAGSPRDDLYAKYTDEEMKKVRRVEQKKAAFVGEYGAQVLLDFTSSMVKDPTNRSVVEDIKKLIESTKPSVVFTHNLADKHDTHVAVAIRTIQALRELPEDIRPEAVYGCEIWRDLDWLLDTDKVVFDIAAHENLAAALLGVFDSQICGGKRYDLATMGRRRAHATYHASHGTDDTTSIIFGMNLTPLVKDPSMDIKGYIDGYIQRLAEDVNNRISKLLG